MKARPQGLRTPRRPGVFGVSVRVGVEQGSTFGLGYEKFGQVGEVEADAGPVQRAMGLPGDLGKGCGESLG